ncbi:MAG TPA: DUF488 family protein [Opitutales bacterium]|nr:DUF488 family protein [Opitutales bacterium]
MSEISLHIYRYGESCDLPGLSIGVARQAPRGVRKEERASRGYFDVWLPLLGPSRELLAENRAGKLSFAEFSKRYRAEMKKPEPRQIITLLAVLASERRINLGCFCKDPATCHRTLLRDLVLAEATKIAASKPTEVSSSPCYLADFWEES